MSKCDDLDNPLDWNTKTWFHPNNPFLDKKELLVRLLSSWSDDGYMSVTLY